MHGEWLVGRRLRWRSCEPRPCSRVANQVIAADPLDRQDGAVPQGGDAPSSAASWRGPRRSTFRRTDDGPQSGQAIDVRMEASIGRVAHTRRRRRRRAGTAPSPVLARSKGRRGDHRVARAALCAVDERIAEAAVGGVVEFPQAVVAGELVRRQVDVGLAARAARQDGEAGRTAGGLGDDGQHGGTGERGCLVEQSPR